MQGVASAVYLGGFYPSGGTFLYFGEPDGRSGHAGRGRAHHREAFTRKEVEKMIRLNKIRDAKTIAGVLYYLRFVASKG